MSAFNLDFDAVTKYELQSHTQPQTPEPSGPPVVDSFDSQNPLDPTDFLLLTDRASLCPVLHLLVRAFLAARSRQQALCDSVQHICACRNKRQSEFRRFRLGEQCLCVYVLILQVSLQSRWAQKYFPLTSRGQCAGSAFCTSSPLVKSSNLMESLLAFLLHLLSYLIPV